MGEPRGECILENTQISLRTRVKDYFCPYFILKNPSKAKEKSVKVIYLLYRVLLYSIFQRTMTESLSFKIAACSLLHIVYLYVERVEQETLP
jgi:hypothetical protein